MGSIIDTIVILLKIQSILHKYISINNCEEEFLVKIFFYKYLNFVLFTKLNNFVNKITLK